MTTITPRERVRTAIRHNQPDRTPYQINFTTPARRKLEDYYGTADLDDLIGNHLAKYRARPPDALGWLADRPGFLRDEFGVVWNRTIDRDIGMVERYPLAERSLDGFTFPDPLNPQRFAALPAFIAGQPRPVPLRQHELLPLRAGLEPARHGGAAGGHAGGAGVRGRTPRRAAGVQPGRDRRVGQVRHRRHPVRRRLGPAARLDLRPSYGGGSSSRASRRCTPRPNGPARRC